MWSEAREAVYQGLPVSGRAGGPGPSPLATVLRHLSLSTPPLEGPHQPVFTFQACLQEKPPLGQMVAKGLLI